LRTSLRECRQGHDGGECRIRGELAGARRDARRSLSSPRKRACRRIRGKGGVVRARERFGSPTGWQVMADLAYPDEQTHDAVLWLIPGIAEISFERATGTVTGVRPKGMPETPPTEYAAM